MFNKNNMRPAYAMGTANNNGPASNSVKDSFKFQNAGTGADEFNEFNSFDSSRKQSAPQRKAAHKKKKQGFNTNIIIAAAVAAAVILLSVIIIAACASSSGKGIKYDDNAYIVYTDADGKYYIALNGDVIDASFEGEVSIIEAADRSFAYVEEKCVDGWNVYVLDGKEMVAINIAPIDIIHAYAPYEPGIVYNDDGDVYLYTEKYLEELVTDDETAKNFVISGDGTTVAYNVTDAENSNKENLELFTYGEHSELIASLLEPVALSYDGSYVYCCGGTQTLSRKLYYIDVEDNNALNPISDSEFDMILQMNAKGDEIIYSTISEASNFSHIFSVKKEKSFTIAKGYFQYVAIDPEIACPATFKDCYLQNASSLEEGSTYYVDKKFNANKIASAVGSFSPNGQYFYFLNSEKTLVQIDLEAKDGNNTARILTKVIDFEITEKGNLYVLDENGFLRFYNVADKTKPRIDENVAEISLYDYANTLYYTKLDSVSVYSSKEGSAAKTVEFDGAALTGIPEFKYENSAKTYSFLYDPDIGWKIFYTNNGKKFKAIANSEILENGAFDYAIN